jgi:hypothetical protein
MVQPLCGGNGGVPCPGRGEHLEAMVATWDLEVTDRRGALYKFVRTIVAFSLRVDKKI